MVCWRVSLRLLVLHFIIYAVASGSEITQCNKIDKPLVVYRFDVHNNVAYIVTNIIRFYGSDQISLLSHWYPRSGVVLDCIDS